MLESDCSVHWFWLDVIDDVPLLGGTYLAAPVNGSMYPWLAGNCEGALLEFEIIKFATVSK